MMISKKLLLSIFVLVFISIATQAQNPISWDFKVEMSTSEEGVLVLNANLEPGWHLYSQDMPEFGPRPLIIDLSQSKGIEFTDDVTADRAPLEVHDEMFDLDLSWWNSDVSFRIPFKVENREAEIIGSVSYMGCNDMTCSPPETYKFVKKIASANVDGDNK